MNLFAAIAVSLALGGFLGVRWAESRRHIDDLIAAVLDTPIPPDSALSSHPPFGCSAEGGRAVHLPPAGAASTSALPTPVEVIGRSPRPASGDPK